MAGESLKDLGINLINDFQSVIVSYQSGWLSDNFFTSKDWQEIALLLEETALFEQIVNDELAAWERLISKGFMVENSAPANPTNSEVTASPASRERVQIRDYLEAGKNYDVLVNSHRKISESKSKFSGQKLPTTGDTSSLALATQPNSPVSPTAFADVPLSGEEKEVNVVSQSQETENLVSYLREEESNGENFNQSSRETESIPNNPPKSSFLNTAINANDVVSAEELGREINTEISPNVNQPEWAGGSEKSSQITQNQAARGIKGLKDLSAFLAVQPNREHILETNLTSTSNSESLNLATELADVSPESNIQLNSYEESGDNNFTELSQIQSTSSRNTIDYWINQASIETRMSIADSAESELDMQSILEVITQEINREYRRFYGE